MWPGWVPPVSSPRWFPQGGWGGVGAGVGGVGGGGVGGFHLVRVTLVSFIKHR